MFPRRLGKAVAAAETLYVEDVFSAFTDTGTGASLAQVNGVDLLTYGGMVMGKNRSSTGDWWIYDTARGVQKDLTSTSTAAETTQAQGITAFNSNGFTRGTLAKLNTSSATYGSWTFRKAANFFDVVTYTGNGSAGRTVSHSLGSSPGLIILKRKDATADWVVWHRSATGYLIFNTTAGQGGSHPYITAASSTNFTVDTGANNNANGATYVAYVFGHNTASDGCIQCGTFTSSGAGAVDVNLGWEAQFVMFKAVSTTGDWQIHDTARGMSRSTYGTLSANTAGAENAGGQEALWPTALGFAGDNSIFANSQTYVYMAVRKGLMRKPTDATKVFGINARTGTGAVATMTSGAVTTGPDLVISKARSTTVAAAWTDRKIGKNSQLNPTTTGAKTTQSDMVTDLNKDNVFLGTDFTTSRVNASGNTYINYFLKEASGFFDEVVFKGTGAAHTEAHNLGAVPELWITKPVSISGEWRVWFNFTGSGYDFMYLEQNVAKGSQNYASTFLTGQPTTTGLLFDTNSNVNGSGTLYANYLFASVPGVSKIGTYTGNAAVNQINCGFASGARFVLIKRVDSTGDWYFWDTTRGIISGNDPYLLLNSTAIEVTSTDYIDPYSAGFELSSTAPATLNASGGTFMFLAIA